MRGTLTCAGCDRPMQQQPQSLPQGEALCHACRAIARGLSPKRYLPHGDLYCADCGKQMWKGKTSLPQGQARCLPCKRANPTRKPSTPRKSRPRVGGKYRPNVCADCEAPCCGQRCRACRDMAQRIRSADDYRVKRWMREVTALGLSQYERKQLLAKWKRQHRRCTYCDQAASTIDHVVPLVRGGTNHEGNLAPCCRSCNSSKAARLLVEWRARKAIAKSTAA